MECYEIDEKRKLLLLSLPCFPLYVPLILFFHALLWQLSQLRYLTAKLYNLQPWKMLTYVIANQQFFSQKRSKEWMVSSFVTQEACFGTFVVVLTTSMSALPHRLTRNSLMSQKHVSAGNLVVCMLVSEVNIFYSTHLVTKVQELGL